MDPVDRGCDGDAEHFGEHDGGNLGGELLLRCSSCRSCVDPEDAESLTESESGDGPPGEMAGEQPSAWGGRADPGVVGTTCGFQVGDVGGERSGDGDGLGAEADGDVVVGGGDGAHLVTANRSASIRFWALRYSLASHSLVRCNGTVRYWNCRNACPMRVCSWSGMAHGWPVVAGRATLGLWRRLTSAA